MAQQTAVEWFWIHLPENISKEYFDLFEQAKQMEKEQIVTAWLNGDNDSMYEPKQLEEQAEQYYNETYNK